MDYTYSVDAGIIALDALRYYWDQRSAVSRLRFPLDLDLSEA